LLDLLSDHHPAVHIAVDRCQRIGKGAVFSTFPGASARASAPAEAEDLKARLDHGMQLLERRVDGHLDTASDRRFGVGRTILRRKTEPLMPPVWAGAGFQCQGSSWTMRRADDRRCGRACRHDGDLHLRRLRIARHVGADSLQRGDVIGQALRSETSRRKWIR
jgi:hypothetical protein